MEGAAPVPHWETESSAAPLASANRLTTADAGRSSVAGETPGESGGYPMFNPTLCGVTFRPDMFEELLLTVNEQHVARPYSGGENVSERQLLHKNAPAMLLRGQRTSTTGGRVRVTQKGTRCATPPRMR
ncbi:hypothetical_protein [Leishmania major strain Friedlin]|nr:hypothetical_protein [Leishmania major strain Friedlin]